VPGVDDRDAGQREGGYRKQRENDVELGGNGELRQHARVLGLGFSRQIAVKSARIR
jgi:hypothetical protein